MNGFGHHGRQQGGNGSDPTDFVAIIAGAGAAFLWADPAFEITLSAFRQIALRNYGREMLDVLEWAYWAFLHLFIFAATRVATKLALAAIITAVGYRLALSF
ncbi:hypothetical protein ACFSUD_19130 [Sulfitobacter aestuarii]|uniref:AzlD domain-containing protein n=1 Tax=Sulfitobacter aestuarii TaxID=2161676 RepID=A0ABW5U784_9RHOB